MQFDDLGGLEEASRLRREPHHQHRADREVGGDKHPDIPVFRRPLTHLG